MQIFNLGKLKSLSLENNRHLKSIPEEICNLKLLGELNLSGTGIKNLSTKVGTLKNLKLLDISNTPLAKHELNYYQQWHRYDKIDSIIKMLPKCKICLWPGTRIY
jgi:Leucine-rich repeat (LRR) protein